jgi:hypothetical protein
MYDLHAFPKYAPDKIEFVVKGMPKHEIEEFFRQQHGHFTKHFGFLRERFPQLKASHIGFTKTHIYLITQHIRCDCMPDLF